MFKKLLLGVLVLLAVIVGVNYTLFSAGFRYEVEREMAAEPAAIIAVMQDLRTWEEWSPWSKKNHPEDGVEFRYEGEPGPGMKWYWAKGKELGDGWLEIKRVSRDAVDYHMALESPMEMALTAGIKMTPSGDKTKVTWWSTGEQDMPGVGRIMNALFASRVKADYAKALEGLEASAKAR